MLIGILIGITIWQALFLVLSFIFRHDFDVPIPAFSILSAFFFVPFVIGAGFYLFFYHLFRNWVKPCSIERFEKVRALSKDKQYKITSNLYLCIDGKAMKPYNKLFFVRIKRVDN